jgi:hypothetical protein
MFQHGLTGSNGVCRDERSMLIQEENHNPKLCFCLRRSLELFLEPEGFHIKYCQIDNDWTPFHVHLLESITTADKLIEKSLLTLRTKPRTSYHSCFGTMTRTVFISYHTFVGSSISWFCSTPCRTRAASDLSTGLFGCPGDKTWPLPG